MILTAPAPAKINLHLHITATRDDGMHTLDTSFAYVDLCDTLTFSHAPQLSVLCSNPDLNGEKNLVYRILQSFAQIHGIREGLQVFIDKKIPEQGGLGGGSSDAATALLVANRLWGIHASPEALIPFATPFGADIPCFLYGQASTAFGIGEQLKPYPHPLPEQPLLLAWPGKGLSTAAVFQHYDQQNRLHPLTSSNTLDNIRRDADILGSNDLERSACQLSHSVSALLAKLRDRATTAWMSGSGSTCIGLFKDLEEASNTASFLQRQGFASWLHIGSMQPFHPLYENDYWDVAKR